jgi:hypothetical protein
MSCHAQSSGQSGFGGVSKSVSQHDIAGKKPIEDRSWDARQAETLRLSPPGYAHITKVVLFRQALISA